MANPISITITAENEKLLKAIAASVNELKGLKKNAEAVGNATGDAGKKGADGLDKGKKSAEGLGAKLADVTIIAGGVAFAFSKIREAATAVVNPGIQFTKQMEFSELGVAGILISMTKLKGETLSVNQALAISRQTISDVQQTAVKFGLPMKDMVDSFQAIIGPGLEAKGTLQEIVQFAATGTKAVKSFGLDSMQTVQEIRSMVSGDINQDSQVAKSLGITSADIANAKQSADGLFKYLNDKLSGFRAIADKVPDTIIGKTERFASMFEQASAEGFKPLIGEMKEGLDYITAKLFVVDNAAKKVKFSPELLETVKQVTDTTGVLIEELAQVGRTIEPVAVPSLKLVAAALQIIVEHVQAVTVGLGTWSVIQKFNSALKATEASTSILGRAIQNVKKAWDESATSVTKLNDTWASSTRKIEVNNGRVVRSIKTMTAALHMTKNAIRGLASATLWGAISVAAGFAVEKIIDKFDKAKGKATKFSKQDKYELGSLSAQYETSDEENSAGVIANNLLDKGGKSYGKWQFALNEGTPQDFVTWLRDVEPDFARFLLRGNSPDSVMGIELPDVEVGSEAFDSNWRELAENNADKFVKLQWQFIKEKFYDVATSGAMSVGLDLSKRSSALQNVIWSAAVQHGPRNIPELLNQAARINNQPNASYLTDEQLIKAIYAIRSTDEWTSKSPELRPQLRDRFHNEMGDALERLSKESPINATDLSLKEPPQDVKELAQAKIALAEAIANGELQKHIQNLQDKQDNLDRRFETTKDGTSTDPISEADYYDQKKAIATAKSLAEISFLEQQKVNQQSMLTNKNLTIADQKRIEAEIIKIDSDIEARRQQLETALQQLDFSQQQALQELLDQGLDALITRLEHEGKLGEAARLKAEKQNRGLLKMFSANKMSDAKTNLEKNADYEVALADYQELNNQYEAYKETLENDIAALGVQLSSGGISPEKYRTELNKLLTEFDEYTVATKSKMDVLAQKLNDPKNTQVIRKMVPESVKAHFNALNDQVSMIQEVEKQRLRALEAEKATTGMSDLTYAERKYEIQRQTAEQIKIELIPAMEKLRTLLSPEQKNLFDSLSEELKNLGDQLPPLQEKFREFAKQGLEEFFTTGIQQCKRFEDAFRNMVSSILVEIQKMFAKEMAAKFTNNVGDYFYRIFGGRQSRSSGNSFTLSNGKKLDQNFGFKFANGGHIESGKVSGPGTGTSDSILAYVSNLGKFIQISNGEYVMKADAVAQWGTDVLDAMNSGRVPDAFQKALFANGGHIMNKGVKGPQELAASLVNNNNTSVPLKIVNVTDPNEVGRYLNSRPGEKVMINWMKNNAGTVRQILNIRG